MSHFPSIDDLRKNSRKKTKESMRGIAYPEPTTQEKLEEKITGVHLLQKEVAVETAAMAARFGYINLQAFAISPEALALIPESQAKELKAICFLFTGPEIRVGALHPDAPGVQELVFQLGERHKAHAVVYQISEYSFEAGLERYKSLPKISPVVKGVEIPQVDIERFRPLIKNFASLEKLLQSASTTDVMAVLMAAALGLKSSDLHIESEEKRLIIRLRVDGVLQAVATLPRASAEPIISRVKLIAGLKINVADRPQDGHFRIFLQKEQVDVRTSILPTNFGESVVMRLLRSDVIQFEFDALGFRPGPLKKLQQEIQKPYGMILTTGPTGSGKTTTLYAILKRLNTKDVKIITLEDPIEYHVEGLNQSQIDYTKDYTFAKGLRALLRQDPDIVMVGEIRDLETAEIAIQSALTGHLILSTIHTNGATGAIPRFLSMGVKPFLLAPALHAIVGQRLVRRLCEACKKETTLEAELLERVKRIINDIPPAAGEFVAFEQAKFFQASQCDACNNTGFKGRVGIYEVLTTSPKMEEAILSANVSETHLKEIAKEQGMVTAVQDGLLKALDGITTVEEVFRIASET
jgi:type II secretory ATPase GspE/PulE/Tfp pilus assembly ATPase PilB-like protein